MITQKEFVRKCYDRYKALRLEPGNKDYGSWEKAHYPLPQPEGDRWIWLLRKDHFIQGVLQSEEVGRCCFLSGTVKIFLRDHWCDDWFEIIDLYKKWASILASKAGKIGGRNGSGENKSRGGRSNVENGTGWYGMGEEEKFEASSKGGKNSSGGEVATSLTYISTATGFVSNPGAVGNHNKSFDYPKEAKARIPDEFADRFVKVGCMKKMNKAQFSVAQETNARNLALFYELFPEFSKAA